MPKANSYSLMAFGSRTCCGDGSYNASCNPSRTRRTKNCWHDGLVPSRGWLAFEAGFELCATLTPRRPEETGSDGLHSRVTNLLVTAFMRRGANCSFVSRLSC